MKKPQKPRDPAINVRIPQEFKKALTEYCKGNGLKQAWVIKKALAEFIGYQE